MANSNQHDTVNGPLVSYVEANWSLAWKAVEEGRTGEGFILAIEGYLIDHRHLSSSENEEIRRDLESAERMHVFHKVNYQQHLQGRQHRSSQLLRLVSENAQQIHNLSNHILKSLTLAHGAAVLATLAYVGQEHSKGYYFPSIIGVCAVGFISSLFGAYLGMRVSTKAQIVLLSATDPYLSEMFFEEKANELAKMEKKQLWYTWPIWFSVGLLVAALCLAMIALWP